jgi:anti-sigma B factor antagonist
LLHLCEGKLCQPSLLSFLPERSPVSVLGRTASFSFHILAQGESIMQAMGLLEVYQAGELTVVGFGGREILDHFSLAEYRDELVSLIDEHHCESLAIDLTGVKIIPSGMLGVLASIHRMNVEVHLYNACEEIREVVEITRLDRVLHLHEVEL